MSASIFSRLKSHGPFLRDFSYKTFIILSWCPAIIFFNTHVLEIAPITGPSMYPYLNNSFNESQSKDVCLIWKWNATKDLQRGMIVSLRSPYHPEKLVIKRIIALEGDTVYPHAPYPYPKAEVPRNHVWVEGDNRDSNKTLDSHHYGPIAVPMVQGKVTHVLWPWKSAGVVPWWQFKGRTKVVEGKREEAFVYN